MLLPDFEVKVDPDLACRDPALPAVLAYWERRRGQRAMPRRGDIDPMDLGPYLGNIILIDVEPRPFRLRYRLIGTVITELMQRDSTGKYYDEIYSPELLENIHASLEPVFEHKAPLRTHGEAFYRDRNTYDYETLYLPLSNDGVSINMILGVLAFHPRASRY